jgi:Trypsin-like peptidase domain
MHKRSHIKPQIRVARAALPLRRLFPALLAVAAAAFASVSMSPRADASSAFCTAGAACGSAGEGRWSLRYATALQRTNADQTWRPLELSDQDYSAFSGVGVVVCSADGKTRSSTAFLVGAFDIGVTVAHTFEKEPNAAEPECLYNSMDSRGQVRERIPVAYVKSQWDAEAGAADEPGKDLAVVRLSQPSRYAQRTMPLGRFSGTPAAVVMVGYKADPDADTVKRKARGTVYGRRANEAAATAGFSHDMDARGIAAGAPVIDERSGVIIGIHTPLATRRNTMITMNDWLEATLRDEMQPAQQAGAKVN